MKKNLIYYMFGILFLLGACYDDKGNYNYSEINEIVVDLAESYVLPLTDTTLVIRPNISQTLLDRKDNLTYTWQCSNSTFASAGNADTISYADTVAIVINPDSSEINYNYYLRFNIYDHEYGIMHPYQTRIQVFKPYQGAWMVLHKQGGETRLGSVEYLGEERTSNNDVYYPATGKKLQGEPVNIACHDFAIASEYFENIEPAGSPAYGYDILMMVTSDGQESGIYNYLNHFYQWNSLQNMIYPDDRNSFDYSKVTTLQGENAYTLCISNGTLYQAYYGLKFYKVQPATDVTGDINITCGSIVGQSPIAYDSDGRRFLYYPARTNGTTNLEPDNFDPATDNTATLNLVPNRPGDAGYGIVDLNAIPEDQEMLYIGQGFKYGELPANVYGYAFAKGSENSYVYEFDAQSFYNSNKLLINYHILTTPEGVDENSCFASGCAYNGILFYTSGNKVYRLDFSQKGGSVSVIYTHSKGTITSMEFAKAGKSTPAATYPEYIYNPNQELGIAIDNGNGTSDFVILDLNTAGSVDESHIFERTFGTIKDIAYI